MNDNMESVNKTISICLIFKYVYTMALEKRPAQMH